MTENGSLDEAGFLKSLTTINAGAERTVPEQLHPVQRQTPLVELFPDARERPPNPTRGTAAGPALKTVRSARADTADHSADERAGYETFYGLHERAFGPTPDVRFLYHSAAHDAASEALLTAISRRDAVTVLTGAAGAGKTMLCGAVIDQLDRRTMTSVIRDPLLTLDDLLERMLIDFGVVSGEDAAARSGRHDVLTAALQSFSASLAPLQAAAVIVIDDAHRLAPEVVDHLDILTSGASGSLVVILLGEPSLLKLLARPAVRALDERIAARVTLGPLAPDELAGYVMHRIRTAGEGTRVEFDAAALGVVFTLTGGLPGAVNAICDRALVHGVDASAAVIDGSLVEQAARDLGLPLARDRRTAAMLILVYLLLMLAGAGAAAWVFWSRVEPLLRRFL